ncbi:hypothetical protein C3Z09_20200 [Lelliottia aquatilis]|uniref:hypothetical protein n=1 Tax=Lelliottia aquatilis TaxID=2080838 RepID=UPI000CDEF7A7|nr:hypothetical protein [Lelliottia aquatilis]POZ14114.1 hypothetical protein C3Z09_20200 [Lelliottia aquatilis]
MATETTKFDYLAIGLTFLFLVVSGLFSFFLHGTFVGNTDALNLVANVFAVLTGFLLLVITMTSDTASILDGLSAAEKKNQKDRFTTRFYRYYSLFFMYFMVLVMIFVYYLLSKENNETLKYHDSIKLTLEYGIAFFTSFSFLSSLFIPLRIKELFLERFELHS